MLIRRRILCFVLPIRIALWTLFIAVLTFASSLGMLWAVTSRKNSHTSFRSLFWHGFFVVAYVILAITSIYLGLLNEKAIVGLAVFFYPVGDLTIFAIAAVQRLLQLGQLIAAFWAFQTMFTLSNPRKYRTIAILISIIAGLFIIGERILSFTYYVQAPDFDSFAIVSKLWVVGNACTLIMAGYCVRLSQTQRIRPNFKFLFADSRIVRYSYFVVAVAFVGFYVHQGLVQGSSRRPWPLGIYLILTAVIVFCLGVWIYTACIKELRARSTNSRFFPVGSYTEERLQEIFAGILTLAEVRICKAMLEGRSNADIGRLLNISDNTVRNHIYNIFRKLEIGSRISLVRKLQALE